MKSLFTVILLTISSAAYCSGSWTPEEIRGGFNAAMLKDSPKLITVVDNFPEDITDRHKPDIWKESEKIIAITEFAPEDIIGGYADMSKNPAKYLSTIGYVAGVYSTLVAMQEHGLMSKNIPKQLTIKEIMDALNKVDAYDFQGSNEGGIHFIASAISESHQCNVDIKDSAKYNAIVKCIPKDKIDKVKAGISNYSGKLISAVDYTSGVLSTLLLAQDYGLIPFCMPEGLTIGETMETLNEFETTDFPETNVGGVEFIFFTLYEKYHG